MPPTSVSSATSSIAPTGVNTVTIAVVRSASSISTQMSAVVHTRDEYAKSVSDASAGRRYFDYPLSTRDRFTSIPAVAPQM